jgi:Holliday junction resolvase RusA-like endonuclease
MYEFDVVPEPKRRPRFTNGKTYTDTRTANYEAVLKWLMCSQKNHELINTAVILVHIVFYTKSRADIDNLVKAVFDAANGLLWVDDRLATTLHAEKRKPINGKEFIEMEIAW